MVTPLWIDHGDRDGPVRNPDISDADFQVGLVTLYTGAAQALLDTTARSRGYDGILSLCSYAASDNAKFKTEALAGVAFRDAVWTTGNEILAQVQAGTMDAPSVEAFLALFPQITWSS